MSELPVELSTSDLEHAAMIYLRLTPRQRHIKRWRERRNHLVCKLLDENPRMMRPDALARANKLMRLRKDTVP